MINEQELAEAVERLREGDDNGLLVKQSEVIVAMTSKKNEMNLIINSIIDGFSSLPAELTDELFDSTAADLLREAYRTKLEHEAGL